MKKWTFRALFAYILFGVMIYIYLFYLAGSGVPDVFRGTSADPTTFMSGKELLLSEEYSKIRNLLFFLSTPYEWLLYFFLLLFGVSRLLERWGGSISHFSIVQTAIYVFSFSFIVFVIQFPFRYLSYYFSSKYGISTQVFSSWMKDGMIDFWVNFVTMLIIVAVLYALMRRFQKRWWLFAWLLSVPFMIFMMFIKPVLIDPLYNDFYPLKDKELEQKILALADEANIPAEHVYEVDMSTKTNAMNAYVTGVGSNSRIVLWDTTLEQLNDEEILFIMAHEMGHYVEKHIYVGIGGYLLLTFIGLWLTAKIMNRTVRIHGDRLKITGVSSISSLPLFLLITSILLFAASPLSNWASRYQEMRADRYAIELTVDKKAGVSSFQALTKAGLSQVHPPFLVKIFRYGHPTMLERIQMIEAYPVDHD